jgi:hypothetical protein
MGYSPVMQLWFLYFTKYRLTTIFFHIGASTTVTCQRVDIVLEGIFMWIMDTNKTNLTIYKKLVHFVAVKLNSHRRKQKKILQGYV